MLERKKENNLMFEDKDFECDDLLVRKKLFDYYGILGLRVETLRAIIQNPVSHHTKEMIDEWKKQVNECAGDFKLLNMKTYEYITKPHK